MKKNLVRIGFAATLLAVATIGSAPPAAEALPPIVKSATLNLNNSTAYYSKTYYSTPRYKTTTGTVTMKVTSIANTWGGALKTGLRTSTAPGESTQFPRSDAGVSVSYRNVSAPPAHASQFAAGYEPASVGYELASVSYELESHDYEESQGLANC